MQPKSIALLKKIDTNIELILLKFQDIFNIALNEDKTREHLAVESLTIESDALVVIRLCEDLLQVSRSLKDTWCLGSMKVREDTGKEVEDVQEVFDKFNRLTEITARFEGEQALRSNA